MKYIFYDDFLLEENSYYFDELQIIFKKKIHYLSECERYLHLIYHIQELVR